MGFLDELKDKAEEFGDKAKETFGGATDKTEGVIENAKDRFDKDDDSAGREQAGEGCGLLEAEAVSDATATRPQDIEPVARRTCSIVGASSRRAAETRRTPCDRPSRPSDGAVQQGWRGNGTHFLGVLDFEERARAALPPHISAYYAAAAGSGVGLDEGTADWSAVRFRPRVLRDVGTVSVSTTILGTPVRTPVLVAPMAQQIAAHPDGEVAMGRAVAATGSLMGVSTNTGVPFAEIARTGAPWWFQVYVTRDRGLTESLVERAVANGARALLFTVDMTASLPASVNPRDWPDSTAKTGLVNLTTDEQAAAGPAGVDRDDSISFDTIGWLRELSGLPVLVKGVLRADDARRCVDAGAAGVVVSTHGGRRLGPTTSTARALPEIVAAVGDQAEIYADSGIRSGEHVAAAIVMGARAVFVGRPVLWALAAAGEAGAEQVIKSLTDELALVMVQLGAARIDELTPDLLATSMATR